MNIINTLLIAAGLSSPVQHIPVGYVSNYDGDTLVVSRAVTTKALGSDADFTMTEKLTVRVENIDTAEINGKCAGERTQAVEAKAEVRKILTAPQARIELVTHGKKDVHGRLLGRIEVIDGKDDRDDLGEMLIDLGLARPWEGSRKPWC